MEHISRHINDLFKTQFLSSKDFAPGEKKVATIKVVEPDVDMGEGQIKPVLRLQGSKDMVLNKTNAAMIANIHGNDYSNWVGKAIAIHVEQVMFKGEMKTGIRVMRSAVAAPQVDIPMGNGTLDASQQQTLKDLYQGNEWPVEEVRRMIREVAGVSSLGQIGDEFYQTLLGHFGKAYIPAEEAEEGITEDDIPF